MLIAVDIILECPDDVGNAVEWRPADDDVTSADDDVANAVLGDVAEVILVGSLIIIATKTFPSAVWKLAYTHSSIYTLLF